MRCSTLFVSTQTLSILQVEITPTDSPSEANSLLFSLATFTLLCELIQMNTGFNAQEICQRYWTSEGERETRCSS